MARFFFHYVIRFHFILFRPSKSVLSMCCNVHNHFSKCFNYIWCDLNNSINSQTHSQTQEKGKPKQMLDVPIEMKTFILYVHLYWFIRSLLCIGNVQWVQHKFAEYSKFKHHKRQRNDSIDNNNEKKSQTNERKNEKK